MTPTILIHHDLYYEKHTTLIILFFPSSPSYRLIGCCSFFIFSLWIAFSLAPILPLFPLFLVLHSKYLSDCNFIFPKFNFLVYYNLISEFKIRYIVWTKLLVTLSLSFLPMFLNSDSEASVALVPYLIRSVYLELEVTGKGRWIWC